VKNKLKFLRIYCIISAKSSKLAYQIGL